MLQTRSVVCCTVVLLFIACALGQTQDKGQGSGGHEFLRATFHVTSVQSEEAKDWCTTGKCSATRLTVEGYIAASGATSSVEYVLHCVEVVALEPTPHLTLECPRVHARGEYSVKVFSSAVGFEQDHDSSSDATILAYDIVSERETKNKKP